MNTIDYTIICVYLIVLIILGFLFRRKASEGIEAYFLGGRSIP